MRSDIVTTSSSAFTNYETLEAPVHALLYSGSMVEFSNGRGVLGRLHWLAAGETRCMKRSQCLTLLTEDIVRVVKPARNT